MKYFTIKEFEESWQAKKHGIDNTIHSKEVIENIEALVDNLLDPARKGLGMPIYLSSGYRTKVLNNLIGGVPDSQHVKGEAADIYCNDMEALLEILKGLTFDQLIIYSTKGFYHVSYTTRRRNRNQILYK